MRHLGLQFRGDEGRQRFFCARIICDISIYLRGDCTFGGRLLCKVAEAAAKILGVDCFDRRIANRVLQCGNANLFQISERGACSDVELHDADMGNDFGEIFPRRGFDAEKGSGRSFEHNRDICVDER